MPCNIFSIETATAPYSFAQSEVVETMIEMLGLKGVEANRLRKLYRNSAITKRHSVLQDFQSTCKERVFWGKEFPAKVPGTEARNRIYKQEAPKLAVKAAKKTLQKWGGDPQEITHVVAVSCTGVIVPGLEFALVDRLGLRRDVMRLGVNFMGCFGAFQGLSVAAAFAKENPAHRVLVVCTELCSLHFQADFEPDTLIANSLFSDGAAAAIVGCGKGEGEKPLWQVLKRASVGIENSLKEMSWDIGNTGFYMRLTREVPPLIQKNIASFSQRLLGPDLETNACDWAIHPGGKRIVQAVEESIQMDPECTRKSWDVLANNGNMSSATILFILKELEESKKQYCASLGFGPGLSVEGLLLQREC